MLATAADRFRLLGDPVRLSVLNHLMDMDEASVQALADAAGQSHQNTSKHLRKLAEGGLVGCRRDGMQMLYRVTDASVPGLCMLVCGSMQNA